MNAIAVIARPGQMARSAVFRPLDLTAIGAVIERLEQLQSGPELDADAFRALGWHAQAPSSARAAWRVRSPLSTTWMPLPPLSLITDCAAILVPPGWDYGAGYRRGHGNAWCRRDDRTFFEQTTGTPAQCLARAALHAWRRILMETHP